ncbi:carbohydrate ABC transporter permease [Chitinibacteraceae bacterium HSL-7]
MAFNKNSRQMLGLTAHYGALVLFAIFTAFPFVWALMFGLSSDGSKAFSFPAGFMPHIQHGDDYTIGATLQWFEKVFVEIPFGTYFKNSVIMSTAAVVGTVVISVLAGYPLARMRFVGRGIVFVAIIATLMLPAEAGMIPNFITILKFGNMANALQEQLGMGGGDIMWSHFVGVNSYFAAVIPTVAAAFGIFLMKQAFEQIPQDLIDAARVDGATEMQILWKIMVPVTAPSIAALAIFTLVNTWNDFVWPLVVIRDREMMPLAVGVFNDLTGSFATSQNTLMAAITLTVLPVLIFFAFTQRYFISTTEGAVK